MADHSAIEWTEATWNPVVGCTHVSPGCDYCYAAREASGRLSKTPTYAGLAVAGKFTGEVRLLPERLAQPLKWRRPRRVFVNSMSDLFHDDVPDEFIARVFGVMAAAPRHTFQVLTKRHGRMRSLVSRDTFREQVFISNELDQGDVLGDRWPLPNVWLGVSVETQQWADIRIPALLDTPAAVRWISAEPLLGPVDLHARDSRTFGPRPLPATAYGVNAPDRRAGDGSSIGDLYAAMYGPNLDWVVVGGESGPNARPMHPDWARALRDQCTAAGVAFYFKQAGQVLARQWGCADRKGHNPAEWPEPFPREYPRAN